jgi:hypothetical protein
VSESHHLRAHAVVFCVVIEISLLCNVDHLFHEPVQLSEGQAGVCDWG